MRLAVPKTEIPTAVHPVTQEVLLLLEMYERVERDRRALQPSRLPGAAHAPDPARARPRHRSRAASRRCRRRSPAGSTRARCGGSRTGSRSGASRARRRRSAKLLLAASELEATRDFLRLLAPLPGFEVSPEVEDGALGVDDVERLARLRLGDGPAWTSCTCRSASRSRRPGGCSPTARSACCSSTPIPVADAEARLRPLVQCLVAGAGRAPVPRAAAAQGRARPRRRGAGTPHAARSLLAVPAAARGRQGSLLAARHDARAGAAVTDVDLRSFPLVRRRWTTPS